MQTRTFQNENHERLLLRVNEAASLIAISRAKFYELMRKGDIPFIKVGKSSRIRLSDLHHWVSMQVTRDFF